MTRKSTHVGLAVTQRSHRDDYARVTGIVWMYDEEGDGRREAVRKRVTRDRGGARPQTGRLELS